MASDSETTRPRFRPFHKRDRNTQAQDISTPVLTFTDAATRDDIYTLPTRINHFGNPRPATSDGTRAGKRVHVADLIVQESSQLPSQFQPFRQTPVEHDPETIGVALGSPTHWPRFQQQLNRPSVDSSRPSTSAPSTVASTTQSFGTSELPRDQPRRRLLSSIFRRTSNAAQRPFYQAQSPQSPQTPVKPTYRRQSSRASDQRPMQFSALPNINRKEPSRRPSLKKPSTRLRASVDIKQYSVEPPAPPPKDSPVRSATAEAFVKRKPIALPQLTLDIPDTTLERYSIMFSDVLSKKRQSLRDRRQSTLKGLMIFQETVNQSDRSSIVRPARRATIPSPRSPRISSFPVPPGASSIPSFPSPPQSRPSRSSTLPSPCRPGIGESAPNSTNPPAENTISPFPGSETSISMPSDSPSDDNHELSDISDEDDGNFFEDEDEAGNIILQLSNLPVPRGIPLQKPSPHSPISKYHRPYIPQARKMVPKEVNHLPRTTSRSRSSSSQQPIAKSKSLALKQRQTLSLQSPKPRPPNDQAVIPTVTPIQPLFTKPLQQFNPLKSSPVTSTDITLARQFSRRRSKQFVVPGAQNVSRMQAVTIVDPETFPVLESGNKSAQHSRAKSQDVMVVEKQD